MALYTSLDIYRTAYSLLDVAVDYVANMPRGIKPLIGHRIAALCAEMVELIFKANCADDKAPFLTTLRERIEEMNLWLRVCRDKRYISSDQYSDATALTTSISKQATRWKQKHAASPAT